MNFEEFIKKPKYTNLVSGVRIFLSHKIDYSPETYVLDSNPRSSDELKIDHFEAFKRTSAGIKNYVLVKLPEESANWNIFIGIYGLEEISQNKTIKLKEIESLQWSAYSLSYNQNYLEYVIDDKANMYIAIEFSIEK